MNWQSILSVLGTVLLLILLIAPLLSNLGRNRRLADQFSRVQRKRKSRVIAIVHRIESMGLLAEPTLRTIDLADAELVLNAIQNTPANRPLDIVLQTPGGIVLAATQIARAIKAHPAKKTVFVPHYALSGGTLIALAADEIVMGQHAVLGPIDPQVAGLPAVSLVKVTQQKQLDYIGDETLILADIGQKALDQLAKTAEELLEGTVSPNAARSIAQELTSGRWLHDHPITIEEAGELGLNVSREMPKDIAALVNLFPDTVRRRASVHTAKVKAAIQAERGLITFDGTGSRPPAGMRPSLRSERDHRHS